MNEVSIESESSDRIHFPRKINVFKRNISGLNYFPQRNLFFELSSKIATKTYVVYLNLHLCFHIVAIPKYLLSFIMKFYVLHVERVIHQDKSKTWSK